MPLWGTTIDENFSAYFQDQDNVDVKLK